MMKWAIGKYEAALKFEILNVLGKNNRLKLIWVPGHHGIDGNEEADKLARKGAELDHPNDVFVCKVSLSVIKTDIRNQLQKEFYAYFNNTEGLRQSKRFIRRLDSRRANELLTLTKQQIRWTVGIFTGHGKFRYHLKTIKLTDDARCRFCGIDEETAEHLLCDCVELTGKRLNILKSHHLDPVDLDGYRLARLYEFLEKIGITSEEPC